MTNEADEMRSGVSAGRAGLMFAILARSAGHEVTVYEQFQPAESFGWCVVFWEGLLRRNGSAIIDAESGRSRAIAQRVERRFPTPKIEVRVLVALLLTAVER